jgi:hypothetical protein
MDNVKVEGTREERRERVRQLREAFAQLRRWNDPSKLPNKAELKAFEQWVLRGRSDARPLFLFRVWSHPSPTMDIARELAKDADLKDMERSTEIASTILRDPIVPTNDVLGPAVELLTDLFLPQEPLTLSTSEGKWSHHAPLGWRLAWSRTSQWLYAPGFNPQFVYPRRLDLLWGFSPGDWDLAHPGPLANIERVMELCAHYLEPSGFPGEETLKRRVANRLHAEFEQRDLVEPFATIWNRVQARAGRSSSWDRELEPGKEFYTDTTMNYNALAIHGTTVNRSLIEALTGVLRDLGLVDVMPKRPDPVDLGNHLHPMMLERLGYEKGDAVPGHRLRISTNAEFTDSEDARVHLDVVVPLPHASHEPAEDAPTLLLVPRPDKPYADIGNGYLLNLYLVRRVFHRDSGTHLYIYTNCGLVDGKRLKKAEDQEGPGLYKCKYSPLKGKGVVLVDDLEHDFPAWTGERLPLPSWA